MSYAVHEIFYSLQGEGANAGRAAVFCRFAGCNLWSGREEDRATAECDFCDTQFVGTGGDGGDLFPDAQSLADALYALWPRGAGGRPLVILTGGEPALQADAALIDTLKSKGFEIAVETNGTRALPPGIDWICVSPKGHADLAVTAGDELKLVYPQKGVDPDRFTGLDFRHFFLQPKAGAEEKQNALMAMDYCRHHARWRLGLQIHKLLGIR
ncbi:MAG: 7-carboxy-7-deazaguanine synthase [Alphaproteobacteria bacterium]|nr:7-carboxy-7-deazaguanine synthase [Alphaproteobacteria bacterium]MBF0250987.1 7-carboxy-7-deazaguanine synthase [Alphaproteobacteria bacterium]